MIAVNKDIVSKHDGCMCVCAAFQAPSISTDPFVTARQLKQHCECCVSDKH